MIITLPRGVKIDIDHVPENLEEIVQKTFAAYTAGTCRDYTYQDKLLFVDCMMAKIYHSDAMQDIQKLVLETYEHEINDQGRLMDSEEFYNLEFMESCYDLGKSKAKLHCNRLTDDRHINEKVMEIVVRVIAAVMNWKAVDG